MTTLAEPVGVAPREIRPRKQGWTVADLDLLPDVLAGKPVKWELWDGDLYPLAYPGEDHGVLGGYLCTELGVEGRKTNTGRVLTEVNIVLGDGNTDTVLIPDLAFQTRDQRGLPTSPEGYLLTVPAIVVEIRSPSNRAGYIREKIERYLGGGAELVWDVDPERRQVTAHRPNEAPKVLVRRMR